MRRDEFLVRTSEKQRSERLSDGEFAEALGISRGKFSGDG